MSARVRWTLDAIGWRTRIGRVGAFVTPGPGGAAWHVEVRQSRRRPWVTWATSERAAKRVAIEMATALATARAARGARGR